MKKAIISVLIISLLLSLSAGVFAIDIDDELIIGGNPTHSGK